MNRVTLPVLDARIDERTRKTREDHAWWPCTDGCDHCCRSLARLPEITEAEWERLREALALLPKDTYQEIERRCAAAAAETRGGVTCPMLDQQNGSCLVYEARPIACRTYGFYTERDAGLHCTKVVRAIEEHGLTIDTVVWGNGEAIADDMRRSETRSLYDWMTTTASMPARLK